ncbi:MAG TPA: HAD-IA family hydrolase [Methylomirabilota bacterium]|jgi:2-haloalkanoic acid dehalogenase type II
MRRFDVLTFDCYGTLIDWERGLGDAFATAARAGGVALDRATLLAAYHEIEPVVQAERYRSYRDVLALTARRLAQRFKWRLPEGDERFLPDSLPSWPPFADTNEALGRLARAGYRLAILSNVDDDLLAATRRHLDVDFEFVVTAQQVGAYKPAPAHWDAARKRIGDGRWLHVAQSYFHDIVPARRLGIASAWINRTRRSPPGVERPDAEFPTLTEAADWLVAGGGA